MLPKAALIIFTLCLLWVPPANASECKDLAKNIVSIDARVKTSKVNQALLDSWAAKLKDMQADFANKKCDPKLLSDAEKKYNEERK